MRELPPGWVTDLAILELSGSTIEDRADHLLIRSPHNPGFHWGNCIFVTDENAVNDAARWAATFQTSFPEARWIAIGLIHMPDDLTGWESAGITVELDEVLITEILPRRTPVPDGYDVRRFDGDDWRKSINRAIAENAATSVEEADGYERFVMSQTDSRRALSARNVAAFFGAFAGDRLVAELGIVRCGTTARFQAVGTDDDHRRRGLASHLLGVAAQWAADYGCERWVIVTEVTNPAGRVYRAAGFEPSIGTAEAYRSPVCAGVADDR
jgi:GNAT superfamily N-acetyltransferase